MFSDLYHHVECLKSNMAAVQNDVNHSISEVLRFRKSAAKYVCENNEMYHKILGLERRIGPIFSWWDNFDLVVFTLNEHRATHAMATELTQHHKSWQCHSWCDVVEDSSPEEGRSCQAPPHSQITAD